MDVRKGECSGGGDHRRLSYLRLAARTSGLPQDGRVALPGQTSCADRARPAVHATSRECDFVKLVRLWPVWEVCWRWYALDEAGGEATDRLAWGVPAKGRPPCCA